MRKLAAGVALACVALFVAPAPAPADEPASKAASKPISDCEAMIAELKLEDPLAAKVRAKFAEMDKALADWDATNGPRIKACEEKMAAMRDAGDTAGAMSCADEKMAILKSREDLVNKYMAEILAMLSPEQQAQWQAYKLFQSLMPTYARLNLTPDQISRIKAYCLEMVNQQRALAAKNEATPSAVSQLKSALTTNIESTLTPDQMAILHPAPPPPPPPPPAIPKPAVTTPPPTPATPAKNTGEGGGGKKKPAPKPKGGGGGG